VSDRLGWLDTNLFVHLLFPGDPHFGRCSAIVRALEDGRADGWIDPVVIHEMTYVLQRTQLFPTREAVHEYIRNVLLIESVHAYDKDGLLETLASWAESGTSFTDVWLAVLARRRELPVCSVNVKDFGVVKNTFITAEL